MAALAHITGRIATASENAVFLVSADQWPAHRTDAPGAGASFAFNLAEEPLKRRQFMIRSLAALAGASLGDAVWANVPKPYDFETYPSSDTRNDFIKWMQANRGEDPQYLGERWDRYKVLVANK